MTQYSGGISASTPTGARSSGSQSTTELARDEAMDVGESVKEAGGHVAQTAADQAKEVAAQTTREARNLMHEGRQQVRDQARTGQNKAAEGLVAIADELREMVNNSGQSGVATEMARQAAERVHEFASWLQKREPGDLLDEVRNFARRRPGAFLIGAALAGVVAGRLTGGVVAAQRESTRDFGDADTVRMRPATAGDPTPHGEYPAPGAMASAGVPPVDYPTTPGTTPPPTGGPPYVPPGTVGAPPPAPAYPQQGAQGSGYGPGGQVIP